MKKFAKLTAVFTALVLALSCFVACSNGDDDSDSAAVQSLQGLWSFKGAYYESNDETYEPSEDYEEGFYFSVNMVYEFIGQDGKYYYDDEGYKFSVSGNTLVIHFEDEEDDDKWEADFEINSDTLTLYTVDKKVGKEVEIYKKVNSTPTKTTYEKLKEMFPQIFGEDDLRKRAGIISAKIQKERLALDALFEPRSNLTTGWCCQVQLLEPVPRSRPATFCLKTHTSISNSIGQ